MLPFPMVHIQQAPDPPLLFVEDRSRPVGRDAAPAARERFAGQARPGEFYVFQVVLFNPTDRPMEILRATPTLAGVPDERVHCLNVAVGTPGQLPLPPKAHRVLWIGIDVPTGASGTLSGSVDVACRDTVTAKVVLRRASVALTVAGTPAPNGGEDDPSSLARLKWLLPSSLGIAPQPTKGFSAVRRHGKTIALTATRLTLGDNGLPAQIAGKRGAALLAEPVRLVVETATSPVALHPERPLRFFDETPESVSWEARSASGDGLTLETRADLAFDGHLRYRLRLRAAQTIALRDVRLEIPCRSAAAPYAMGLGLRGGKRPASHDFAWDPTWHQDRLWLGGVDVGAQWQFQGANYRRPLVNIYYPFRPLLLPDSWANQGRGGVRLRDSGIVAFCGARTLAAGEALEFNVTVQLTPARPIDTDKQWAIRFSHGEATKMLPSAASDGANVLNVHHGQEINPFINYPFHPEAIDSLAAYIRSAHAQNRRVKVYYTTRELTKELPEFPALAALGDAVIQPGPGPQTRTILHPNGPHPRLAALLGESFLPAWQTTLGGKFAGREDLSVITRPDGPWNEFYLHGLDYLCRKAQIDGVYIDDTALDRASLLRARRLLEAHRPDPLIDLHSWNPFDHNDAKIVSASLYLELLPFVDRIWLGEGANYEQSPDAWLVQYSGIAFGVMGEMLEGGGNPWRGMLFGMTCRLGWSGDPRPLWKFWDAFGMTGTKMTGWWDPACPAATDRADIPATVYQKPGRALLAVASWASAPAPIRLRLNAKTLGFTPRRLIAPAIGGFQDAATFAPDQPIPIAPGKGYLLIAQP